MPPLLDIVSQARRRGWWQRWNDVLPGWFDTYLGLESEASHISEYEPQLVPGILQTADDARAVIRAEHPDAFDAEIEKRVELRLQRQNREVPPRLWIVLDEAVLQRVVGGSEVMRNQLKKVVEVAGRPGNDIQVLPFAVGEHGSMGSSFSILSFPDVRDAPCVHLENRAGSLYLEEGSEIAQYTSLFEHLKANAAGMERGMAVDLARALWRKSTRSNGSGNCVEVAGNLPNVVAIRDGKDPAGPVLVVAQAAFAAFAAHTTELA